jgi:hypothetical protein
MDKKPEEQARWNDDQVEESEEISESINHLSIV